MPIHRLDLHSIVSKTLHFHNPPLEIYVRNFKNIINTQVVDELQQLGVCNCAAVISYGPVIIKNRCAPPPPPGRLSGIAALLVERLQM